MALFICSEGFIPTVDNPRCKPTKIGLSSSPESVDIVSMIVEIEEDDATIQYRHVGMWWRFWGDDPRVGLWVNSLEWDNEGEARDAVEWLITNLPETPEEALKRRINCGDPWVD